MKPLKDKKENLCDEGDVYIYLNEETKAYDYEVP